MNPTKFQSAVPASFIASTMSSVSRPWPPAPTMTRSSAIDLREGVVGRVPLDATAAERREHRAEEDLDVRQRRLEVVDVLEVELDPIGPHDLVAAFELRPAGDPGPHLEAAALALVVALHLVGKRRARADHAHVTPEDVQELGDLVEREAPEEASDAGDVGRVWKDRVVAGDHRAELHQLERLSAKPDPLLAEEDRPA